MAGGCERTGLGEYAGREYCWYYLPLSVDAAPFAYRRCLCIKCLWTLGRRPHTGMDIIRGYQLIHPESVRPSPRSGPTLPLWSLPPADCVKSPLLTCPDYFKSATKRLGALKCRCSACESRHHARVDDRQPFCQNIDDDITLREKSMQFWRGLDGPVTLFSYARHPGKKNSRFTTKTYVPPYPDSMYNFMGLLPPPTVIVPPKLLVYTSIPTTVPTPDSPPPLDVLTEGEVDAALAALANRDEEGLPVDDGYDEYVQAEQDQPMDYTTAAAGAQQRSSTPGCETPTPPSSPHSWRDTSPNPPYPNDEEEEKEEEEEEEEEEVEVEDEDEMAVRDGVEFVETLVVPWL